MSRTLLRPFTTLCPDQAVEQRPCQHKSAETTEDATGPEIERSPVVSTRVEWLATLGEGVWGDLEDVVEHGGDYREDEVEEEALVGLETKDASGDTEERGRKAVNVCEGLERRS